MSRKGWTAIFVIVVVVIALALGGALYYSNRPPAAPPLQAVEPIEKPKVCTQEAKQCPDGSYVSRTGPNCEFQACP